MVLSLARMYFPVKVLGPGNRVGIWVTGCEKNCPECISPELQKYDSQKEVEILSIIGAIKSIAEPIDGFTISGGEPFLQTDGLYVLIKELEVINDDILLFTGYTKDELIDRNDKKIEYILSACAAIVDGPYIASLNNNCGLRGSSNQKIIVNRYHEKYKNVDVIERKLQVVRKGDSIYTFGIPGRSNND